MVRLYTLSQPYTHDHTHTIINTATAYSSKRDTIVKLNGLFILAHMLCTRHTHHTRSYAMQSSTLTDSAYSTLYLCCCCCCCCAILLLLLLLLLPFCCCRCRCCNSAAAAGAAAMAAATATAAPTPCTSLDRPPPLPLSPPPSHPPTNAYLENCVALWMRWPLASV
jgi:hypothetical protein